VTTPFDAMTMFNALDSSEGRNEEMQEAELETRIPP